MGTVRIASHGRCGQHGNRAGVRTAALRHRAVEKLLWRRELSKVNGGWLDSFQQHPLVNGNASPLEKQGLINLGGVIAKVRASSIVRPSDGIILRFPRHSSVVYVHSRRSVPLNMISQRENWPGVLTLPTKLMKWRWRRDPLLDCFSTAA